MNAMAGKRLIVALAVAAVVSAACSLPDRTLTIYSNEDLSGTAYSEPVSTLTVTRSAGWVCYANDNTGQDRTQYYVDCDSAERAGAL